MHGVQDRLDYLEGVRSYYLSQRDGDKNIYEIWEEGRAFNDSITPSVYSLSYRSWIVDKLRSILDHGGGKRLLSLGSGNAFVEHILHDADYDVLAVDVNEPAVELARAKGVPAEVADVLSWTPRQPRWDVIYADGFFGHVYDPETRLQRALCRMREWLVPGTGKILISNDGTKNGEHAEPAPGVCGFYWLSEDLLRRELLRAGFLVSEAVPFLYNRPISGPRRRVVIVGTLPA